MGLTVWRISKTKYVDSAFDGAGAHRSGGRWNEKGTWLVYTSSSLSLATLETLVGVENKRYLRKIDYSFFSATIPDGIPLAQVERNSLPDDWITNYQITASLGSNWARANEFVALLVPSAVTQDEDNILLNPHHPDFDKIIISQPVTFNFDPRLFK